MPTTPIGPIGTHVSSRRPALTVSYFTSGRRFLCDKLSHTPNFGEVDSGRRRLLSRLRHTFDFRAMQAVRRNGSIPVVLEVQSLRRNGRKDHMPKFPFPPR